MASCRSPDSNSLFDGIVRETGDFRDDGRVGLLRRNDWSRGDSWRRSWTVLQYLASMYQSRMEGSNQSMWQYFFYQCFKTNVVLHECMRCKWKREPTFNSAGARSSSLQATLWWFSHFESTIVICAIKRYSIIILNRTLFFLLILSFFTALILSSLLH